MARQLRIFTFVLFLTLLVVFSVNNKTFVEISLWPFAGVLEIRLFVLMLLIAFVSYILGRLSGWVGVRIYKQEADQARAQKAQAQAQLDSIRKEALKQTTQPPAASGTAAPKLISGK